MSVSTPIPLPFEEFELASLPSADEYTTCASPDTEYYTAFAETAAREPASADKPTFVNLFIISPLF